MTARTTRNQKLDLRLTVETKRMLTAAAVAERRSVSDFVVESAIARAQETLNDRRRFVVDAEKWDAFMAALDAAPTDLPRLKRLLNEPSAFSKSGPA